MRVWNIYFKKLFSSKVSKIAVKITVSLLLIYLLTSVYFVKHNFFRTSINGVDVSLKAHDEAGGIIRNSIKTYALVLVEREGGTEKITGQEIGMHYNEKNSIFKIYQSRNPIRWVSSLLRNQEHYVNDLFSFNKDLLEKKISELNCLNKDITEPRNVSFTYSNGSYEAVKEIYGNKVKKDNLIEAIENSILEGKTTLNLEEKDCYENPKYTLNSAKIPETKKLLDKYAAAKITYLFGIKNEVLDANEINKWLSVDEDLNVVINEKSVREYVQELGGKYDTVGVERRFKTSVYKVVEVKGGFYGWKINRAAETKALLENIKLGKVTEKEPTYSQRALYRDEDDIGSTYVEINITRQHLWFYKVGKLVAHGAIVTGNPNRRNATDVGVYMINYKQEGTTLTGPNYAAEVSYWMPFNGDIGIHDATWRHSFGGNIYKSNGSHGCVNVPLYLARKIFDNIEAGTPVICYEE